MTKQVFIINGSGGVGKDTVCSAAAQSWKVQNISSITPILQVAKAAGWDGTKTPAARRFLSQLKADCTEFNDLPSERCLYKKRKCLKGGKSVTASSALTVIMYVPSSEAS